jgi:hypothetical protein
VTYRKRGNKIKLNNQANITIGLENCWCAFVINIIIKIKEKDMEEPFNKILTSFQNGNLFV